MNQATTKIRREKNKRFVGRGFIPRQNRKDFLAYQLAIIGWHERQGLALITQFIDFSTNADEIVGKSEGCVENLRHLANLNRISIFKCYHYHYELTICKAVQKELDSGG